MGFIKGSLVVIASVLLFLSFLAGNLFLTLSMSLEYKNIHEELAPVIKTFAEEGYDLTNIINKESALMETHCQNNSEYVFSKKEHTYVVPCEIVAQGSDAVIDHELNKFVEDSYYKDYDCGFLDCFEEEELPFFLVSEKAKNYWWEKFYFALIISIVLIIIILLLIENKTNLPILVGVLLIIASLPFMKLNWFFSLLPDESFLGLFSILVSKSYAVFLTSAIIGLIILGIGILLKFFKIGFKIATLFSKKEKKISKKDEKVSKEEVKKIVKEEISESKKKPSK